jgi:hypothetical protein
VVTHTDTQLQEHRKAFINECQQRVCGAPCRADWISKGVDQILADYKKLQEEDRTLEADIKELASAIDNYRSRTATSAKPFRRSATI